MKKKNRNKFRVTRFVIFKLAWVLKTLSNIRKSKKRLLIVRLDAIGDYVLFRNYIEVLRKSTIFANYEIELLGNSKWEDLALLYDSSFLSKSSFIDPDVLEENPLETFKLALTLFRRQYEVVLQPTYSRTLFESGVSAFTGAKQRIAYDAMAEYQLKYLNETRKFYSKLVTADPALVHETEFNHHYFQNVLGEPLPFIIPTLKTSSKEPQGILIFPGSSSFHKNWEKDKFVDIVLRILKHTEEEVTIVGGSQEMNIAEYILGKVNSPRVLNKTGLTTLPAFVDLISSSKLIISNDTNAVHIAAACRVPAVCILGGGHFGRFLPYPERFLSRTFPVYSVMPCYNCRFICAFSISKDEPYPCISNVDTEQVWVEVLKLMNETITRSYS